MPRPGKFQAIAIMQLVSGILGALSYPWLSLAFFFCITPFYGLVVAIFEIVAGARGLGSNAIQHRSFYKTVAILEIINIISGNVASMVVGILVLVFLADPEVEAFFAGTWRPAVYAPQHNPQQQPAAVQGYFIQTGPPGPGQATNLQVPPPSPPPTEEDKG